MDSRQEALDRTRHLRKVASRHLDGALKHLTRKAIGEAARRLGLLSRRTIAVDNEEEMTLAFDLAVFAGGTGRHSRAIDRYARAHPFPEDSDEAVILAALPESLFHIMAVKERHPLAGLIVEDIMRDETMWHLVNDRGW